MTQFARSPRHAWLAAWMMASLFLAACSLPTLSPRQITLLDGEITVRAPQFYCVAQQASRSGNDTAVVLIGRCSESGNVTAALVTVTLGRFASGGVMLAGAERLRQYLGSTAGRRAMSRSGRAADVTVLDSGVTEGTLLLHLRDTLAGEYWRAIIGIEGRLVTVSASGAADVPLSPEDGRKLVEETVAALIKANPATKR